MDGPMRNCPIPGLEMVFAGTDISRSRCSWFSALLDCYRGDGYYHHYHNYSDPGVE